jgi:hypothetical protein
MRKGLSSYAPGERICDGIHRDATRAPALSSALRGSCFQIVRPPADSCPVRLAFSLFGIQTEIEAHYLGALRQLHPSPGPIPRVAIGRQPDGIQRAGRWCGDLASPCQIPGAACHSAAKARGRFRPARATVKPRPLSTTTHRAAPAERTPGAENAQSPTWRAEYRK